MKLGNTSVIRGEIMAQTIDRQTLEAMMNRGDDFALVEVLSPEQYHKFHLPGAVNVPLGDQFEESFRATVPNTNRTIVVYCSDENCPASPSAARQLEEMGYADVYDYAAGKWDWQKAGLPIEGQGRIVGEQPSSG